MKRIFLFAVLAACGGGSPGDDAGAGDTGSDTTQSNDAAPDGVSSDATNDGPPTGDGSINPGLPCDPQNNQCKPGLLCCSEPTHMPDAAPTAYVCEQPDPQQQCPKLP